MYTYELFALLSATADKLFKLCVDYFGPPQILRRNVVLHVIRTVRVYYLYILKKSVKKFLFLLYNVFTSFFQKKKRLKQKFCPENSLSALLYVRCSGRAQVKPTVYVQKCKIKGLGNLQTRYLLPIYIVYTYTLLTSKLV